MYPRSFHYHRANSLHEASALLSDLGSEARLLAGGQSLIPLMKLRFTSPQHLVDLSFVPRASYIKEEGGAVHFGALTCHADIQDSALAGKIPIVHDCAAGIADVQIRNRGTIGGSVAEADPSGDWAPVLLTLTSEVHCVTDETSRVIPFSEFIKDAYITALKPHEVIREVVVKIPPRGSGGAYVAFKRCAPVYASASVAVQLTMEGDTCRDVAVALGTVGLTPVRVSEAEASLRGQRLDAKMINRVADAAQAAADPQIDMRGSMEYKRALVAALTKRAIQIAAHRARGEQVEAGHYYA